MVENEQKKAGEHSAYFPKITNQSNVLHVTELQNIGIPAGAFGAVGGALVPAQGVTLPQGQNTFFSSGTQISQPLTQLIRIHAANRIAAAEVASSRDDLKKAENEVALQVHTLYYGILIARLQKQAAEQQTTYAGENLRESEEDVRNGSALNVAAIQGRAGLLESQQAVLTAELQLSDLTTELNDLLGLPLDTQLDLDPAVPSSFDQRPREEYVQTAWSENPEISGCGAGHPEGAGGRDRREIGLPSRYHSLRAPKLSGRCSVSGAQLRHVRCQSRLGRIRFRQTASGCARAPGAIGASSGESTPAEGSRRRRNRAKL